MSEIPKYLAYSIAKHCHMEINRHKKATGEKIEFENFNEAPEYVQNSACETVSWIVDHPEATSSDLHDNICTRWRKAGWIGAARTNIERKEQKNLVPWDVLPQTERDKYKIMLASAHSYINKDGFADVMEEIEAMQLLNVDPDLIFKGFRIVSDIQDCLNDLFESHKGLKTHPSTVRLMELLGTVSTVLAAKDLIEVQSRKNESGRS